MTLQEKGVLIAYSNSIDFQSAIEDKLLEFGKYSNSIDFPICLRFSIRLGETMLEKAWVHLSRYESNIYKLLISWVLYCLLIYFLLFS